MKFEEWEKMASEIYDYPMVHPRPFMDVIPDWKAEREEYIAENTTLLQQASDREMYAADREKLIGALEKYGEHSSGCAYTVTREDKDCSCGFCAILAGIKEQR